MGGSSDDVPTVFRCLFSDSSGYVGATLRGLAEIGQLRFMSPQPLKRNLAHCFGFSVFYPAHEFSVKLEICPASFNQKTAYVLSIPIGISYQRCLRYPTTMPVKISHPCSLLAMLHNTWLRGGL
jgi:hypothetical protein